MAKEIEIKGQPRRIQVTEISDKQLRRLTRGASWMLVLLAALLGTLLGNLPLWLTILEM